MRTLLTATLTALALTCPAPVLAQGTCEYAPAIVSLGETILAKRPDLPRLQARRFGSHALYLMMRYSDVADERVEQELTAMLADGVPLARDLAFAWSYGMSNGMTERLLGPDAVTEGLRQFTVTAARSMLREGDVESLMSALSDPATAFGATVIATLDYTDEQKAELADTAMAHDMPLLAAGFAATQENTKAFPALAQTLDADTAAQALQMWYWWPPAVGNPMLPRKTDQRQPGPYGFTTAKFSEINLAAMQIPQYDFLNTLLNQSGEVDEVVAGAEAINEAVADGLLDPRGTLDQAWLLAYQAVAEAWDTDILQRQLASFDVVHERSGGADRTLGVLDRIIAIDALTPFLRGETDEPPEMPALFSPNAVAEWPRWLEVAASVKANPSDPAHVGEDTIAAEMLFAAGNVDELASLIDDSPATLQLLRLATDIAIRLDRRCESYLWHPAESTMLAGTPIFKFDGRDNQ